MWRLNGNKVGRIDTRTAYRYRRRYGGHTYRSVLTKRIFLLNRDSNDNEYPVAWVSQKKS